MKKNVKVVQAFWSKPVYDPFTSSDHCGWIEKKYMYFSIALSCLYIHRHFKAIELVTDKPGKVMLVDKLRLPYSSVDVCLDILNSNVPVQLKCFAKYYALSKQTGPFLYFDSGLLWNNIMPKEVLSQGLAVLQTFPANTLDFLRLHGLIVGTLEGLKQFNLNSGDIDIHAADTSLIFSSNPSLLKDLSACAFDLLIKNNEFLTIYLPSMSPYEQNLVNLFFDEYLFYVFFSERQQPVTTVYNSGVRLSSLDVFYRFPGNQKVCNIPYESRRNRELCERIEYLLKSEFPDYFVRIMHLLKTMEI